MALFSSSEYVKTVGNELEATCIMPRVDNVLEAKNRKPCPIDYKCWGCGGIGNRRRGQCPRRTNRSGNGHVISHISAVCTRAVVKDQGSRVEICVTNALKRTTVETRSNRSTVDNVDTAKNVLECIKNMAMEKVAKIKQRRERRKPTSWVPKRKRIEHPLHVVDEDASSDSTSTVLDEFVVQIQEAVESANPE